MILHQEVIDRIGKEVETIIKISDKLEQIKKVRFVKQRVDDRSGELTATLKLRRKIIQENFLADREIIRINYN